MLLENIKPLLSTTVAGVLVWYILGSLFSTAKLQWYTSRFPIINKEKGEWLDTAAVNRVARDLNDWLQKGYRQYEGPFQIIGSFGKRIVLPPEMAHHVKTDPRFSADEVVKKSMASTLPGFQGLRSTDSLTTMIRTKLSTNLSKFTQDLADEIEVAFEMEWGTDTENWKEVQILPSLRNIVTQVSTRIFLGPELCRDKAWLDNIQDYTMSVFHAVRVLRAWPEWSRRYVQWFMPECKKIRDQVKHAEEMIEPVIQKRIQAMALAQQGKGEMPHDAMAWMHQIATQRGDDYHAAHAQLSLSMASVHTTSDLTSQVVLKLCHHRDVADRIRNEVNDVRNEDGTMSKTGLYNMKFTDSVMKETQRIKPLGVLLTHRYAHQDVTLPDGTFIPKGAQVGINMSRMWDPSIYPDPQDWVPDRFLKLREEPGRENSSQFVTTTMESLGFGIGTHACPGRFFAGNKVKLLLAYILDNYDFERVEDGEADAYPWYIEIVTNPKAKLRIRRKKEGATTAA